MRSPDSEPSRCPWPPALLAAAADAFELDAVERVEPTRGGLMSNSAVLRRGREAWVLKERPEWLATPERHAFERALYKQLEGDDIPVAGRLTTRTGGDVAVIDGREFELFRYVSGRSCSPNDADLSLAAEMLARLHRSMGRMRVGKFRDIESLNLLEIESEFAETYDVLADRCARGATGKDAVSALEDLRRRFARAAADAASRLTARRVERQIIHGDYGPEQLLFSGNKLAAVLDFDSSGASCRLFDIAHALIGFAARTGVGLRPRTPFDLLRADELDMAKASRFLAAYSAIATIDADDSPVIMLLANILWMRSVMWVARWDTGHNLGDVLEQGDRFFRGRRFN